MISESLHVAVRPFAKYRELGDREEPSLKAVLLGPIRWLAVVAMFVAWTTSGALLPEHLLFAPLSWAFVPAGQMLAITVAARTFGTRSNRRVVGLYYAGQLPFLGFLMLVAGTCLLVPQPWQTLKPWLGWAPALAGLLMAGWSILLTFAMFRSGFGFTNRRSAGATTLHYAVTIVAFTSWFLFTGQLLPLWGVM